MNETNDSRTLNDEEVYCFEVVKQKMLSWLDEVVIDVNNDRSTYDKLWGSGSSDSFLKFWIGSNGEEIRKIINFLESNFHEET